MTTATASANDAAALAAIGAATRELHLPTVRAQAKDLAEAALRSRAGHLAYLAEVLSAETDERAERRRLRRIKEARFPRPKSLVEFDTSASATVDDKTIALLASSAFLDKGEPIVLLGDSVADHGDSPESITEIPQLALGRHELVGV